MQFSPKTDHEISSTRPGYASLKCWIAIKNVFVDEGIRCVNYDLFPDNVFGQDPYASETKLSCNAGSVETGSCRDAAIEEITHLVICLVSAHHIPILLLFCFI
jgi:hypothetical protein